MRHSIEKMRACLPLLPDPGGEVVAECLDEIESLREQLAASEGGVMKEWQLHNDTKRQLDHAQSNCDNKDVQIEDQKRQLAILQDERLGRIAESKMHPLWLEKSKEELLDALRFQGATTAALLEETELLYREVAAKDAVLRQAYNAIALVEWGDFHFDKYGDGQHCCPECGNQKRQSHAVDCPVGVALAAIDKELK